jgi:hypothetical protein
MSVESAQRDLLVELSKQITDPGELVLALWAQVSSPELRPFVRLFFECVAATGDEGLTDPWLDVAADVGSTLRLDIAEADLRLDVDVTRGLLIDVLATGDTVPATAAIERFVAMWRPDRAGNAMNDAVLTDDATAAATAAIEHSVAVWRSGRAGNP